MIYMAKTPDRFIFDTCIFCDFWRQYSSAKDILSKAKHEDWDRFVSAITIAELWYGIGFIKKPGAEVEHEDMIRDFFVVELSGKLARISGKLAYKYCVGTNDSIILASAQYFKMGLITSDKRHHEAAVKEDIYSQFIEKVK